MHQVEFDNQLERITASFPKLTDGVMKELERRWLPIDGRLFTRMVSWVIDHSRFTPVPKSFQDAYDSCRPDWDRDHHVADGKCSECNDLAFVTVYALIDDRPAELAEPCPSCNRYKSPPRPQRSVVTPITRDQYLTRKGISATEDPDLDRMGPHGANFVLELMDRFGTKGADETTLRTLTYKAAEHKSLTCPHCRRGRSVAVEKAIKTMESAFDPETGNETPI